MTGLLARDQDPVVDLRGHDLEHLGGVGAVRQVLPL
jgi:hypothetical protein